MTETGAKPRRRRAWRYLLWACLALVLLLGALAWYVATDSFQAMVRRRLVAELERSTGGRVELGGLHTIPFRFRVDVRDLTIHGLEQPGEVPYAHVDQLVVHVRIISVLGAEFGFSQVVLERPVVHIIVYPDGTTNQPQPRVARSPSANPGEPLFAMSIGRLEVRRGTLLWNDQKIPLDFTANDVAADMTYSLLHQRYSGNLLLGKVDTRFKDYRPVAWTAEAHFTLARNSLEIQSLKATSGRSHLQTSGRLDDFRDPKFEGAYDLSVDLSELAAIARRRDLRRGVFAAAGRGRWSLQDFSSQGEIRISELEWRDSSLRVGNASLTAQFSVDPRQLKLERIQSRLLGGSVSGEAEIANWRTPPPVRSAKGARTEEQKGTARLHIADVSIAALAAAVSTPNLPFDRMDLAGSASGTVAAQWKGAPRNLEGVVALEITAPVRPAARQLPLTARVRATYRGTAGELQVSELSAATRATQVHASGTLSRSAALKLSLTTSNVAEWQPILAAFGAPGVPLRVQGQAAFSGTATGRLPDVTIAGNLQIEDFDSVLPARSPAAGRTVHWDSLAADLQLSRHNFALRNGRLRHGEAGIRFELGASLQDGRFTGSSPFTARASMRNADLAELVALAGYDLPVTGKLNLRLQASGTRAQPHGEGQVLVTGATVYGEPVERFYSDLRFVGGEAELNNIQLTHYEARVRGGATYDWLTHAFHFNLKGTDFDLLRIPALQASRMTVEGRMDFSAAGSGTLEEPVVNATVHLRDLTLDHERAGDFNFEAVTQGADLRLNGRSQFEHAELSIDGNVHLRGDWPATINLRLNHLDVDPLLRTYLRGHLTGHSAAAGEVQLRGPLRKPRDLDVAGNLSDFSVELENIRVHNDGALRFLLSGQVLKIEQFRLLGEGTDLSATGTVQLSGDHQLDLRAQGSLNLQLIESLNPDFTSSGLLTMNVAVSGTARRPAMQGRLEISKGNVAYIDLPSALSDINGSLLFNQDRLQIESLTAHVGGGQVKFGGYVTTYNRQLNFDLSLEGQDVRLRYPPGVSSTTTANLRWVGTPTASTLSGDMLVNKLGITPGFDFGAYLERAAQATPLPQTNPLLNRIKLDVHIVTTPELQMQTAVVRLSGDADLRLRGSAAKPVLLGRADVLEGEVYINGTKYRLERGDVTFTNPVTTTPVLDLQATTRVRDYDITLNLNGHVDKLNVTYRSEPPLPTADIIALLALGRTQQESAVQQGGQSAFTQEASSAILAEALNATVSNRVQRLFGVSRIKIDPQGYSTETSPVRGPQVTIEQQVANNLTVIYSTNVSQASQQIIQVEYNITRNISIVGIRDQNGVVSFDVRIRRRRK
jgi:translocation and assembly module TamB